MVDVMIYIVDAIMGTGKTSAAINMMNSHAGDKRYMFVTPYLMEADRIVAECPGLSFAKPTDEYRETNHNKTEDLKRLISEKRNIALSHELYSRISPSTADAIKEAGYTLIIDEVVDVFKQPSKDFGDIDLLVKSGCLVPDEELSNSEFSVYRKGDEEYLGTLYQDVFQFVDSRRLIGRNNVKGKEKYYCWLLNRQLFMSAEDTYILTYMFEGSAMSGYFKINNLGYVKIGVRKTSDGYTFSDSNDMPEYAAHIREYVHVVDHKINKIGDKPTALSKAWYQTQMSENGGVEKLRKNVYNYFMRISKCPAKDRLWTTFKGFDSAVRGEFFRKGYVSWNLRATNEYINTTTLAFLVNIYANPALVSYMKKEGVEYDQDKYALSALVQWIWRSAVRVGGKVTLYLPSSRMRRLLNAWMDDLESGGDGSGFTNKDVELAS